MRISIPLLCVLAALMVLGDVPAYAQRAGGEGRGHHGPRFQSQGPRINPGMRGNFGPRGNMGPRMNQNFGGSRNFGPRANFSGPRNFVPNNRSFSPRFNNAGTRMNPGIHNNNNYGPRTQFGGNFQRNIRPFTGTPSGTVNGWVGRTAFPSRSFQPRQDSSFRSNFGSRGGNVVGFPRQDFSRNRSSANSFRGDPATYNGAPYQNFRGYNQGSYNSRSSFLNYLPGGNPTPPVAPVYSYGPVSSYNFVGDPANYRGAPYQNFRGYNGGFGNY